MAGLGIGGGKVVDQQQAVRAIGNSPFGEGALWLVGGGLAAYALWRFAQVLMLGGSTDERSRKIGKRAIALISGIAYAGLASTALAQAAGRGSGRSGSSGQESGAALLLNQPFGRWLVAAVGLAVIGAALFQFGRAWTASFSKNLRGHELSSDQAIWSRRAGRMGYAARGVAFALMGWFFLQAALQSDASEAGGLAEALRKVASQPHGQVLLAIVGAGLALFGVYSLIEARYRRIS
ncbi:MAG: hypothetical protein AVDCRST_MAG42-40 [uncultured Chthoniobacterales bacterium]|uniref:DUF1206 domain-containing protein n=1 Tax=uncultured Chthoniobacterales bacterium TaxID=1836801 RepID=A0A6J4H2Z5_9BACT|nr:MAG: hypothetical protein AVDCRST_MAG42-40 [uncultured Chthoniobacterales bacterium]